MRTGNFSPRALASSTTSVMSTSMPPSCSGRATTCPSSLMSKYFAPQRSMLYSARADWMLQSPPELVLPLISMQCVRDYMTAAREYNLLIENISRRERLCSRTHLDRLASRLSFGEPVQLNARNKKDRKKMRSSVLLFDDDLRSVARRGQNKVRVLDPILFAIGHSNGERTERNRFEQFANLCFHTRNINCS